MVTPARGNPLPMQLAGAVALAAVVVLVVLATQGSGGQSTASSSPSSSLVNPSSAISSHGSGTSSAIGSPASTSAGSSSQNLGPTSPTVRWLDFQDTRLIAGGVELDLGPLKTHESWSAMNGELEVGEPGRLPGVTPRAIPFAGPLAENPRLAKLKNGMGQLPVLQIDAGAGFQLPIRVDRLKTLQLEFLRDTGGAISEWCSLQIVVGQLVVEVGRVAGEARYHRLLERGAGKPKELARAKLTLDYLDHDETLHEVAVIVRGRKVEVVIIAGTSSWKLETQRDAVSGSLGVAVAGAKGSIRVPRLTLAAGKLTPAR